MSASGIISLPFDGLGKEGVMNPPFFMQKTRLFSFQNVCLSIVIIGGCNILK